MTHPATLGHAQGDFDPSWPELRQNRRRIDQVGAMVADVCAMLANFGQCLSEAGGRAAQSDLRML